MLRTILFITGFGIVLGAIASFHRIADPFNGTGPEKAFTALFWFVVGTVLAAWSARRVLAGITKIVASWVEGEDGNDFVTLWIRCKKAELRAKTSELLTQSKSKAP